MDIVFTLLEQWGIATLGGVILIYFAWHAMAFLHDQPVTLKSDPILTVTTLGWGSIWLVGNGLGNSLFLYAMGTLVYDLVVFYTGSFAIPTLPGIEALIFLIGLMPSLYQFRYQADPHYLGLLSPERRVVAILLTVADGLLCAVGWYWWLLPPTFTGGAFTWIYDQTLLAGCLAWGIFASYIAQFMAHMQVYELLGLSAPALPNPLRGIGTYLATVLGSLRPHTISESPRSQGAPSPRQADPTRATRTTPGTATPPDYSDEPMSLHFDEPVPHA
jgi:hypothetical protein